MHDVATTPDQYDFQDEGVDWLADGALTKYLADEMGMGKSVQEIRAADRLGVDHIDVICPAIAVEDWARKFHTWSDYGRTIIRSFKARPFPQALAPRKSVIINGFESAVANRALYKANRGGILMVDEAQYLMNPATMRAKALYGGDCCGFGGISQNYDAVWVSSGTPTPNGDPRELWAHLHALRPYSIIDPATGLPMSYNAFGDRFCFFKPGLGGLRCIGTRNEPDLLKILGGPRRFMLRRLGNVAGLPDVRFEIYPMVPHTVPRELDPARWPDLTDRLDAIIDAAGEGDMDTQLEEEMATLRRLTGLLKVEATVALLTDELRRGQLDKVVVFGYHVDVVNEIAKRLNLAGFRGGAITGATSSAKRWELIDGFNADRDRFIAGQILATATNTSLGGCRHVLFAETDWVGDNNVQAAFRCRRIDSHRDPILARILSITGTLDERIQAAARRKMRQSRLILPTSQ
jgi:SWI/SNF-related matrix-associated actin-dependent regulator 1 of chromatin subfamily A